MSMAARSPAVIAAVLMVATVFACFAPCAPAAEMAPSPSPDSGADGAPNGQLDKEVDLRLRLLDLGQMDLTESEFVEFEKYMDQLEVSIGGKDFRFEKTVWDLGPKELGFRLGVVFAQAALQCNIITRVTGDPSRPPPQIPFFIREKLRLSGIMPTPRP